MRSYVRAAQEMKTGPERRGWPHFRVVHHLETWQRRRERRSRREEVKKSEAGRGAMNVLVMWSCQEISR